jgi:hypothetical protein
MKIITGKNDTGKTRALIQQSLDSNIPIFALYESAAESLRAKSMSYFNKVVHVVTPQDFKNGNYCGAILVDDLEKNFSNLLAAHLKSCDFYIAGATVTEE